MPEQSSASCDVVDSGRPAAGPYRHLALDPAIQLGVCDTHLAQLEAGRQPTVITGPAEPDAPQLLLPLASGAH